MTQIEHIQQIFSASDTPLTAEEVRNETGYPLNSVRRHLLTLRKQGVIKVTGKAPVEIVMQMVNIYEVNDESES